MRLTRLFNGILQQAPQGPETVLPADFLAFLISSSPVTYSPLVNSQSPLGQLHRNLRFEAESIFLDWDRLNHVAPERLIAGFHIGEINVGKRIRKKSQN